MTMGFDPIPYVFTFCIGAMIGAIIVCYGLRWWMRREERADCGYALDGCDCERWTAPVIPAAAKFIARWSSDTITITELTDEEQARVEAQRRAEGREHQA